MPPGFENLDTAISTVFDVYFDGRRVGAAGGRLEDGTFVFNDPAAVAALLQNVDSEAVAAFLAPGLPSNEALRCPPGETLDCGVLLSGISGIIVDPDTFRVDIFLGGEFFTRRDVRRLGEPVSGPSLIQGLTGAVSANNNAAETFRFGVALDTLVSLGRNSFVSRIFGDDSRGFQADEMYVQRYAGDRRYSAGLFNQQGALALSTLRMAGAQLSSFHGTYLETETLSASRMDVVLPRPARVEIYRDGVLVSSSQYSGGLQTLDVSRLPTGSYPVRIVARDASGVVLDEVRVFTRANDLPPPGRWVYSISVGVRLVDTFAASLDDTLDLDQPFFPESSDDLVVIASASRRVARSFALGMGVTMVDEDLYPELTASGYWRSLRGFASIATGPDGQYAAVAGASGMLFGDVSVAMNVRVAEASPLPTDPVQRYRVYRPFLRDEQSVNVAVQRPLFGGVAAFRGSYGQYEGMEDRYILGLNYSRPVTTSRFGSGLFTMQAVTSDTETRVGFRFSLFRGRVSSGSISTTAGAEYITSDDPNGRDGFYPTAQLGYSRAMQVRDTDMTFNAIGGVSSGDASVQAGVQAISPWGEGDVAVGAIQSHNAENTDVFLTGNVRTGFVVGGGQFAIGGGLGDAAVIVRVSEDGGEVPTDEGRFRVVIDEVSRGYVRAGDSYVSPMLSFTEAEVSLEPEAAPPFEIDLAPRTVPLYPGNVVVLDWAAISVVTTYGRILDAAGQPLVGAVVSSGNDLAVTGQGGYFSVTAPTGSAISVRAANGGFECPVAGTVPAAGADRRRAVVNLGALTCAPQTAAPETAGD